MKKTEGAPHWSDTVDVARQTYRNRCAPPLKDRLQMVKLFFNLENVWQKKYRDGWSALTLETYRGEGGQCSWVARLQWDLVPRWIPEEGEKTRGRGQAVWPNTDWCSGDSFSFVSKHTARSWSFTCLSHTSVPDCSKTFVRVRASGRFLTCRTGLLCIFGKLVGLFSHRIRSLPERHFLLGCDLSPPPCESLVSSRLSSSRPNRRRWWSRYAALRDRKRANHLWKKEAGGRRRKPKSEHEFS